VLYEALTGGLPYDGSRAALRCAKQRADSLRQPALPASVPDDLRALCLALLRVDPRAHPDGRARVAVVRGDSGVGKASGSAGEEAASHAVSSAHATSQEKRMADRYRTEDGAVDREPSEAPAGSHRAERSLPA